MPKAMRNPSRCEFGERGIVPRNDYSLKFSRTVCSLYSLESDACQVLGDVKGPLTGVPTPRSYTWDSYCFLSSGHRVTRNSPSGHACFGVIFSHCPVKCEFGICRGTVFLLARIPDCRRNAADRVRPYRDGTVLRPDPPSKDCAGRVPDAEP
jgi:hypothetical protein